MDDRQVIDAFLKDGVRRAFGPTLHVEGDVLMLNGWWHASFRVADNVFTVRNEPPREESTVLEDVMDALREIGLGEVAVDHPLVQPITYTEIALGQMSWTLWSTDFATGDQALIARAGADKFFTDAPMFEPDEPGTADFSAELGGARKLAGLPAALVLTVGLDEGRETDLRVALADCRLISKSFAEFPPSSCGALIPGVIVVDASDDTGRHFIMELRTEACGRFIPVVAVTESTDTPLGADEALDPRLPASAWAAPLRALLP